MNFLIFRCFLLKSEDREGFTYDLLDYDNKDNKYDVQRNEKWVYKRLADMERAQRAFSCAYACLTALP